MPHSTSPATPIESLRRIVAGVAGFALAAAGEIHVSNAQTSPSPAATAFYASSFSKTPAAAATTEIGRLLFFDRGLSASGRMACSTCHDPRFAYGPPDARTVHSRGADAVKVGLRAAPSLRYLQTVPPFTEHRFDESVDESVDQGPSGGHTWDGRADTLHDQARLPLLSPLEMANKRPEDIVRKVRQATYAVRMRAAFGEDLFDDDDRAFKAILLSLEVFQQSPAEFYPYSSRYDAWLRGRGELSAQELHGLELFNAPGKGNCASCHPSQVRHGALPQFTDFGYAALAVPRNGKIKANANPRFFDLGLCGPQRLDLLNRQEYCAMFRVPTLRNVAVRQALFHNGRFDDLETVVRFYAQRDTAPEHWYSRGHGSSIAFDDLPSRYFTNVNREPPFGRRRGDASSLTAEEISDIVAFLRTLTDADIVIPPHKGTSRTKSALNISIH